MSADQHADDTAAEPSVTAKRAPRQPCTYTLMFPVQLRKVGGEFAEEITELQLGRLNGADHRRVMNCQPKGPGEFLTALVCASARIPPSTFDKLDAEDVTAAAEIAGDFLGNSPPTSKT